MNPATDARAKWKHLPQEDKEALRKLVEGVPLTEWEKAKMRTYEFAIEQDGFLFLTDAGWDTYMYGHL